MKPLGALQRRSRYLTLFYKLDEGSFCNDGIERHGAGKTDYQQRISLAIKP
ncbi:MAG: hypothetical protein KME54_22885 [Tolypothrix brevis GSE-NOS-MK-07-07A]|nr:hypothetical protein [Tolypothrix brevis GSE-NOS-MK-07-07A]